MSPTPAPTPKQAKAARKGKTGAAANEVTKDILRMTHVPTERTFELDLNELGPGDDRLTRKVCGYPVSSFISSGDDKVGADGVSVLWWLARQKAGEVCAFGQSEKELGTTNDIMRDMDITRITSDDEDDVEGSEDPT